MSNGLEPFNTGWDNNQNYITSIAPELLDPAGFDDVMVGSLDTFTNIYASGSPFGPNPLATGKKLTGVVTVTLGVSMAPIVVTATYHNQFGVANHASNSFTQGSATGTARTLYMAIGDEAGTVTNASVSPRTSGTIQLLGSMSLSEEFDNTMWGPPSPGL